MITFNKEKDIEELLRGITKLTPEDFIALAKVLDVKMSLVDKETGEYTLRDAEEIIQDMVVSFRAYKHKERKMILKAVKNSGTST
jgi:plasmid maintenance system antidote protein VapI